MTTDFLLAMCLIGGLFTCVLACYALHISISTHIKVAAFEKSTHNVQYVPLDQMPGFQEEDEDAENAAKIKRGDEDAWGSLDDMEDLTQRGTSPLS